MYSRIISVGSYQPDNIVTNKELEHKVNTSDEWIKTRTGIESRAIAEPRQATSDLAILAADAAIKKSDINICFNLLFIKAINKKDYLL